jgi:ribosome-associated translation inhibitor RaiA
MAMLEATQIMSNWCSELVEPERVAIQFALAPAVPRDCRRTQRPVRHHVEMVELVHSSCDTFCASRWQTSCLAACLSSGGCECDLTASTPANCGRETGGERPTAVVCACDSEAHHAEVASRRSVEAKLHRHNEAAAAADAAADAAAAISHEEDELARMVLRSRRQGAPARQSDGRVEEESVRGGGGEDQNEYDGDEGLEEELDGWLEEELALDDGRVPDDGSFGDSDSDVDDNNRGWSDDWPDDAASSWRGRK